MIAKLLTAKLFSRQAMLDDNTRQWLYDTFTWAISNFDVEIFSQKTQLVLPNNTFYPGSVSTVHQMASNVFKHTVNYANMQHWPLKLLEPEHFVASKLPVLHSPKERQTMLRGDMPVEFFNSSSDLLSSPQAEVINISYLPSQVNQPQDLISSFAQQLATLLVIYHPTPPPGGKEFVPQAIDVLACVLGFGVIFTNTAYQFRGGCGSCNNPAANRQSALPEYEMCYALALFCYLKQVPVSTVLPQLKSHLRRNYKKMYKEIASDLPQSTEVALLALL